MKYLILNLVGRSVPATYCLSLAMPNGMLADPASESLAALTNMTPGLVVAIAWLSFLVVGLITLTIVFRLIKRRGA